MTIDELIELLKQHPGWLNVKIEVTDGAGMSELLDIERAGWAPATPNSGTCFQIEVRV